MSKTSKTLWLVVGIIYGLIFVPAGLIGFLFGLLGLGLGLAILISVVLSEGILLVFGTFFFFFPSLGGLGLFFIAIAIVAAILTAALTYIGWWIGKNARSRKK